MIDEAVTIKVCDQTTKWSIWDHVKVDYLDNPLKKHITRQLRAYVSEHVFNNVTTNVEISCRWEIENYTKRIVDFTSIHNESLENWPDLELFEDYSWNDEQLEAAYSLLTSPKTP